MNLKDIDTVMKEFLKDVEFENFKQEIDKDFSKFRLFVQEIDASLVSAFEKGKKNVFKEIEILEGKTLKVSLLHLYIIQTLNSLTNSNKNSIYHLELQQIHPMI